MECISKRVNKIKDNAVCRKLMALQTGNICIHMYVSVSMHEIISFGFFNAPWINTTYNITFDHKERSKCLKIKYYAIVTFTHPILTNKRHNKNCNSIFCN